MDEFAELLRFCSQDHWAALTVGNGVGLTGWVKHYTHFGKESFLSTILDMENGSRPKENGAIVLAGAVFQKNVRVRKWLRRLWRATSTTRPQDVQYITAVTYALCPHMDADEEIVDILMQRALRWSGFPQLSTEVACISDVLQIWRTSNGSGICSSCKASGR
jgi:hypothetical protein